MNIIRHLLFLLVEVKLNNVSARSGYFEKRGPHDESGKSVHSVAQRPVGASRRYQKKILPVVLLRSPSEQSHDFHFF